MNQYDFSPQARLDLLEIHDFVAQDAPLAAARLIGRLEEACQTLAKWPDLGQRRDDLASSLRCFAVGSYAVFYRQVAEGIQIVRLVSGARNFEALFDPEA